MEDSDSETNGPSEQDFQCSCCYELMVNPTTLNCGHSFCRFCLAQWWYSSRKTTCPECRQSWHGFPNVNILLRKTIKKLFPLEVSQRQFTTESLKGYAEIVDKFETFGRKRLGQRQRGDGGEHNRSRWLVVTKSVALVAGIVGILMFFYDLFGILTSTNEPLVSKPVTLWTPEDVSKWVASLGPWAKETYENKFLMAGINGKILITLAEKDLEEPILDIKVAIHRRALIRELDAVRNLGVKPPTDLWEYKAAHPARCMFLLWGLREFPRATTLYAYFALHDEMFMPLLYHTSEHEEEDFTLDPNEPWHPSTSEYFRFVVRVLLTPYYLLSKFAFKWLHVNSWTVVITLLFCVPMTCNELIKSKWLLLGGWKELPSLMWQNVSTVLSNGLLHLVIWHFIPTFIADIVFYWMLFLGPVYAWNTFRTSVYEADHGTASLARAVLLWVWRKVNARLAV